MTKKKGKKKKLGTQKNDGYNRCICGMIIPHKAKKCSYCMLEEAGYGDYRKLFDE